MAFYNLIHDNFIIIRTKTDKFNLKCRHCKKLLCESRLRFDWDKWSIDTHQEFVYLESRVTFHLLFKCKISTIQRAQV